MDTMQYEASQSEGGGHCVMVPVIICVLSDDEEDIDSLAEELPQCDGSTSKSSNSKQLSVHSEYGEQLENIQINLAKRSFDAEILRKASQNRKRFLHDADIRPLSETFWESKGSPCKHVTSGFHIALDSQSVDEPMSLDDGSEKAVPAENLREQSKVDVNLHHSKEASKLASIIENTSRALDSTVGHVKDTNLAPEQTSLGSVAENTEEGDEREEGPIISVNEEKHSYILEAGNKKGVVEGKLHNGISVPFCDEQTAILVESDKLAENCKQKSLISSSVAPMTNVLKEKTHKCSLSLKQESVTNRVALDHPQIATQQGQTLENCVSELCSKKISVKNVTRAIKSARRKELKWEKRPDTKPNDKDILNVQKLKTTEACSCVMCQSVFSRKIKHPILTHCDSKSYICKLCDYATNRKKALKIHVRIHTDIKPYKCGQCASACHTCHKSCNDCDYTERKESSLQAHTVPHTSTGLNSLRLHNKQHLDVGARFKCDQCEYFSNNSYNLQCHSRIHTGEKPYHCEECDYSFRTLSQLNRHKLVHLTSKVEEQFKCKQCKALFPSMRHLGRHARSHLELKQIFSCDQCDYSTYSSYNLKVHIRTHTGEKPYRCSECKTTFRTPSHLNRHKQIHLKHN